MSQKPKSKAKTKKQMKKSINRLWNALQEEKAKHARASTIIGHMKLQFLDLQHTADNMQTRIVKSQNKLELAYNREEHAAEVTAKLVKNLIA